MSKRRDFLKWTGAGIVAGSTGILGNAAATSPKTRDFEEFKEDMQKAKQIGREEGLAAKKRFLRNNDYRYTINRRTVDLDLGGSSGDSRDRPIVQPDKIENPDDGGIELDFSGYHDTWNDQYSIDLDIYYNFEASWNPRSKVQKISYGETPIDGAGIFYKPEEDYWHLANGNSDEDIDADNYAEYDSNATSLSSGKVGFRFDDYQAYHDWQDEEVEGYRGTHEGTVSAGDGMVYLEPHGAHDPKDRVVYARYTHAHDTINISPSLSLGYPPSATITAGFGTSVNQTRINDEENGDWLRIYQDDM